MFIRIGQVVYNIAKNPRIAETAKNIGLKFEKVARDYKGKVKTLTEKGFEKLVEAKTPSKTSQLGGALRRTKVDKNTPGAEKNTITVGKTREKAKALGDKVVGGGIGGGIGTGVGLTIAELVNFAIKKAPKSTGTKPNPRKKLAQKMKELRLNVAQKRAINEALEKVLGKEDPKAMEKAIDKGLRKVYKQGKRGGNNFGMNKGGMIDMRKTGMFYGGMARKK